MCDMKLGVVLFNMGVDMCLKVVVEDFKVVVVGVK